MCPLVPERLRSKAFRDVDKQRGEQKESNGVHCAGSNWEVRRMQTTGTKKQSVVAKEPIRQAHRHEPTEEEIRQRAYEIYLARGAAPGDEVEDWLQAERELRLG